MVGIYNFVVAIVISKLTVKYNVYKSTCVVQAGKGV